MRRMVLLLCLAVAGWPAGAFGWNMPGHRVVADIAWQNMDPAVQTEAARLLRQHPDYAERFEYWRPAGFSGAEEARWRFRQGAAWADLARGTDFDRPQWHYVNLPVFVSDAAEAELADQLDHNTRLAMPDQPLDGKIRRRNIVQAIHASRAVLEHPGSSDADRALALTWLLHLVGDIHQPLHTVALFGLPNIERSGDQGGNLVCVRHRGRNVNLHSWWDGLVTQHESNPQQEARASELLALHGDAVTPAHLAAAPADWAAEGQVLAAAHVYTPEMRERAERHLNGRHCREFNAGYVQRPVGYIDQARAVAERQAVLAGLRLAALMETLLD